MEKYPPFGKRNSQETTETTSDPVEKYRVYAGDAAMQDLLNRWGNIDAFADTQTRLADARDKDGLEAAMAKRYEELRGKENDMPNAELAAVQQAVATIEGYKAQTYAEGAVDSEPNQFDAILARLHSGEINAPTALVLAHHVAATRSNYH